MTGGTDPRASVIVSTYDQLEALRMVVAGFSRQSRIDFELLVADDGSGPETAEFLEEAAERVPFRLRHVRQEDRGFRKSRILNLAAARARAPYLIFNDGDCIPHGKFVESHLEERGPGQYLVGRSVLMSRAFCRRLDVGVVLAGRLDGLNLALTWDGIVGESRRVEYSVRPPLRPLRRVLARLKTSRALFGHNFSLCRADYLRVNGFDEAFSGWGAEDEELGVRLRNAGFEPRAVVFSAINYHYWHPRDHAWLRPDNERRLAETRRTGRVRAEEGVDRHLEDDEDGRRRGA